MKELQYRQNRQKKLLQYLIELNDFKPVRYFSERLSCSDKTIRNDLKYFEEQSIKIEKISGKGIRLSNKNKILINDLLDEQPRKLELTTEQRRMKILYDLLDGTKLSIQSLSDNYFVSKTSIVNDFKVIEEKLSVYGLKLKKDVSGTKLIGEETNIRKALVDILNQMINYNNNSIKKVYSRIDNATLEELEEHFGNKNIEKIEKIIGNVEAFLNYKITDPYYINLVTHILILIRLCHNKQLINSHFYRGVSELPYKLLFAVIYTHLEFRYEVSHTITSHHVHHFHQTRIPDGTLLDYMVQYRKPLFPQFFLYPKKFLPENNPHHKEFHLRPYIQNNANQ